MAHHLIHLKAAGSQKLQFFLASLALLSCTFGTLQPLLAECCHELQNPSPPPVSIEQCYCYNEQEEVTGTCIKTVFIVYYDTYCAESCPPGSYRYDDCETTTVFGEWRTTYIVCAGGCDCYSGPPSHTDYYQPTDCYIACRCILIP